MLQRKSGCACGGHCPRCQHDDALASAIQPTLRVGAPNDRFEQEANRVADQVMRMPEPRVQRQAEDEGEEELLQVEAEPGRHLLAQELIHVAQQNEGSEIVQRSIGDGHDLTNPRFAGDPVLEACYDGERFLRLGHRGPAVQKIQGALVDFGFPLPEYGVDGIFGTETQRAVQQFQASFALSVDGVIGLETMGRLDALPDPLPLCPSGAEPVQFASAALSDPEVRPNFSTALDGCNPDKPPELKPGFPSKPLLIPTLESLKIHKRFDPPDQNPINKLQWAGNPDNASLLVETGVDFEATVRTNGATGHVFFMQNVMRTLRRKHGCQGALGTDAFDEAKTPFVDSLKKSNGIVYDGKRHPLGNRKKKKIASSDAPLSIVAPAECPGKEWPSDLDVCLRVDDVFRLYVAWESASKKILLPLGNRGWSWSIAAVSKAPGSSGTRQVDIVGKPELDVEAGSVDKDNSFFVKSPVITGKEIAEKHFAKVAKEVACSEG